MRRHKKTGILLVICVWCFLVSAQFPELEFYLASPVNLPEWAEQGNFRFIRLDGGEIEVRKAERTWWGMNFTEAEKDSLANVYTRDFEKIVMLLKQAGFNWVWVTWSNGWSMREEAANREELKEVIERFHQEGIKVTAYLSSANMFWWSVFRDEPEMQRVLLKKAGFPIFYGGSPHRVLADTRNPEWRSYILKKVELALDSGVDAIFYDNIFGDNEANRLLLIETQMIAEKKAKETGRPKALVYANIHIGPERFDLNDQCEILWDESGKSTPGVFETGWQVGNIRKIKFLYGAKQSWQTLKYENDRYHCGPRETCIPPAPEQKLAIAEAYAFGAVLSRNIEGRFLNGLLRDEPYALSAWKAIAQYNKFIAEHKELYNRVLPVARIALLSQTEKNPFADAFIKNNVMFQTKVLSLLNKGTPLNEFKFLVIPFAIKGLAPDQERILTEFIANGGKIFSANPEKGFFRKMRSSVVRIPKKIILLGNAGEDIDLWIKELEQESGGALISIENGKYIIANITRKPGADIFIIHLLNYELKNPAKDIRVKLDLNGFAENLTGAELTILSPDETGSYSQNLYCNHSKCEFRVRQIQHYCIAVISALKIDE